MHHPFTPEICCVHGDPEKKMLTIEQYDGMTDLMFILQLMIRSCAMVIWRRGDVKCLSLPQIYGKVIGDHTPIRNYWIMKGARGEIERAIRELKTDQEDDPFLLQFWQGKNELIAVYLSRFRMAASLVKDLNIA